MPLRGIIFDLDGVLILSSDIHSDAYKAVLTPLGISDFHYPRFAGMRTRDCIRLVLSEHQIPVSEEELRRISAQKTRLAFESLERLNPLAPGAIEVLHSLTGRFTLALASSASRRTVDGFLDRNNIRALFSSVISGEDVVEAKPSPAIYRQSCAQIQCSPDECLVIEDSLSGIAAAKAAGIRSLAIPTTETRQALTGAGADLLIESLAELPSAVEQLDASLRRYSWTALIPAAGRGSRLGYDLPKILFPIAGRTILEWLIRTLNPVCDRFVFVLAPLGRAVVEPELERLVPGRFSIGVQSEPLGMAHAVECGLPLVSTPNVLVVWGDQAALQPHSVFHSVQEFEDQQPSAALPTVWRQHPYIHFERDSSGRVVRVLQAREGDTMPETGESDAGLFLFKTDVLRHQLQRLRSSGSDRGALTQESNFLPIFVLLSERGDLIFPRGISLEETIGVNSRGDADSLEQLLKPQMP